MKVSFHALLLVVVVAIVMAGCSGSKPATENKPAADAATGSNREAALTHYLNGSALDQKEDYAAAILEYQDALRYDQDPSIHFSIAKDYAILGKGALALEHAHEAVRLAPDKREYRETLAEILVRALQFDSATAQYFEIIRIDSNYRQGWYTAGRLLAMNKKPKEAIDLFQKYINYFGQDFDVCSQLVQLYGAMDDFDNVVATLKQMSALEPTNAEVKRFLGDTYLQSDSLDASLEWYKQGVAIDPDDVIGRASLARAYLLKKDKTKALEQIEAVMTRDSVSADDQIQFGQIIISVVARDSTVLPIARDLFGTIRKNQPKDWRPYWFLGAIANIERNDTAAIAYFNDVTKLASWNADAWAAVASIYYDNEKFDRAIEVMDRAKAVVPKDFRVYFITGISQQRLHNDPEAAKNLEQAIQLNEKSVDALSALGLVYDEMARHDDSDTMYERALRVDPKNALVLNNYGYSLSERNVQLDRALKMSEEAVRQAADNQSYLDTKGWIFYQLGRYEEAETHIKRAVDLGSKSPVINEHLGDVYAKMHKNDKAVEYWQKALNYGSTSPGLKDKIQRGGM